jgi:glycosyltransferase involved in cell wall biosynthesis
VAHHVVDCCATLSSTSSESFSTSRQIDRLRGKHGAVLLFSHYPSDPRPRRAAEALAAQGVTLDLFCLRAEKELKKENFGNVSVFRLPLKRHRAGRISYVGQYSAFILSCFIQLFVRSFRRRYDFVHVHNMPDVLVFSALIPKLFGAKVILDLHDPMPELMQTIFNLSAESLNVRILKRLEKWSIAFADLVLTVNLACKKLYSARSCPAEKIHVILNSPDDAIFRARRNGAEPSSSLPSAEPFKILYHGSLVRRNGFDLAVDALERLQPKIPFARLVVCGERTPYFAHVMEAAQIRGLDSNIEYLGVRNLDQIVQAIKGCDLGIIPNHRNMFTEINTPTRIFEYLSLGKPVIAPNTQGIRDYFGEKDLIYFNLGDANDLASKIEFAFSHPHELAETVKRGQEIYRAHTWSREKETLLVAVSELI